MKLIDVVCPSGHTAIDVFVRVLHADFYPACKECGQPTERLWAFAKAPGITPQGTQAEINTDVSRPNKVDTKAIALETTREIEDKWLRYSDEKVAEQHVQREIDHKAGLRDEAGNEKPLPQQTPITFEKPALADCAI